jgi:hypothetical protein
VVVLVVGAPVVVVLVEVMARGVLEVLGRYTLQSH